MVHQRLTGWRFAAFVSCLVGALGMAVYPIIINPILNPESYKNTQKHTRRNIIQEEVQPGNMKVWSDPFDRKKKSEEETKS